MLREGAWSPWPESLLSGRVEPLEETEHGQQHVAITDATETALRRILVSAVVMTLLFVVLRRLVHSGRGR